MKHWWWKFLAVALLLTASIAALVVPLAPDIVHVSPERLEGGPVTVKVTGYNTSFAEGVVPVLDNAGRTQCPTAVRVLDATHLEADFMVDGRFTQDMTDLVIGDLRYPGAFYTQVRAADHPAPTADTPCTTRSAAAPGFRFPNRSILYESIRNLHFHVPMWFTMIALMSLSVWHSIKGLGDGSLDRDRKAVSAVHVGLLFCGLGLVTGALWARATWGAFWTNDVKLNGAAVTALIYLAYLVLRGSVADAHKRARLSAIYNIFAFMLLVLFLFVVPRLNAIDSLHPGNGGNSGFNDLDLDNRLRLVFYPAVAGWVLLGLWLYDLRERTARITEQLDP